MLKIKMVFLVWVFSVFLVGCSNQTDVASDRTEREINRTIDSAISTIGYNLRRSINTAIDNAFK